MKLKELEDFDWFPARLRQYQMEMIGILASYFGFYKNVANMIKQDLVQNKISSVVDLCSGSGLPAVYIHQKIRLKNLHTTLSDKYPQNLSQSLGVHYLPHSIDALHIPLEKENYYTMHNAFHHFNTDEQQKLIQKALDHNAHFKIVELVQPTLLNVVLVTLASTFGVWLLCPLIRPFDWKRILFTYIIPINVLTVLIDGYITILKSKTKQQYHDSLRYVCTDLNRIKISSHWRFPACLLTIKISPQNV